MKSTLHCFLLLSLISTLQPSPSQAGEDFASQKAPFQLPPLPYPANALEPHIDAKTMNIHHGKHHAAYVNNLNAAIEKTPALAGWTLDRLMREINQVPESVRQTIRDNGGGHYNHSLFWITLSPTPSQPSGPLAEAINAEFGSLDNLFAALREAGMKRFGSGWAWLSLTPEGKLIVESTPNQDNPLMHGNFPLLGIDVWEHAYYLNYQNRRSDYLDAIRNVIHWPVVETRFQTAKTPPIHN